MICSVCKKQKNTVTPKKSGLMKEIDLFLCNECLEDKREPRYLIVLAGRSGVDMAVIRPYLKNHRYVGDEITAKELLI